MKDGVGKVGSALDHWIMSILHSELGEKSGNSKLLELLGASNARVDLLSRENGIVFDPQMAM